MTKGDKTGAIAAIEKNKKAIQEKFEDGWVKLEFISSSLDGLS